MSERTQKDGSLSRPFFSNLSCLKKRRLFRISAILLVILPFLVLEGVLRLLSPSWLQSNSDPLMGFSSNQALFELNATTANYQIKAPRLRSFVQNGFPTIKTKNTFRVFCLGGSTVQGRPYSVDTAFTTWLRIALQTAYPEKIIEIVNCGGVSYASYRLAPILQECLLNYQPDLMLLCTGNNEFLEDRSYSFTKKAAPLLEPVFQWASDSKVVQVIMKVGNRWTRSSTQRATLGSQVNAMLDYERGIERYHRNEKWKASVENHFRLNINRMLRLCRDHEVPAMLVSPCFNLKDSPPFKSESTPDLSDGQTQQWNSHLESASESMSQDLDKALNHLLKAVKIDTDYAATWYALGQTYLQKGRFQIAKQCFQKALEQDVCPLRINTNLRSMLKHIADQQSVPYYDLQELAVKHSTFGITGNEFLIDHVHPTIRGHQIIGLELANQIQSHWLKPTGVADLNTQITSAFEEHLNSIPDVYFLIGMERLKGLKAWTQGRADGEPIENHPGVPNGI
ncbi:tetratricopeptide repeat protein [bacterium]|nr:tetratricopeptide repeat protein [bacterium]